MSVFSDAHAATFVTIRIEPSPSTAVAINCVVPPRVTVVRTVQRDADTVTSATVTVRLPVTP